MRILYYILYYMHYISLYHALRVRSIGWGCRIQSFNLFPLIIMEVFIRKHSDENHVVIKCLLFSYTALFVPHVPCCSPDSTLGSTALYHSQHHSWDCSLATPMITNIDTEAEHAHVHKDAVRWGGPLPSASIYLIRPTSRANCLHTKVRVGVKAVRMGLRGQCVKDHLGIHAWCVEAQPFSFCVKPTGFLCLCGSQSKLRQVRQKQAGRKRKWGSFAVNIKDDLKANLTCRHSK